MSFTAFVNISSTKEAQTFAIRLSAHHKPHIYMGKSAPCWGSPNNMCLLVSRGGELRVY